MELIPRLLMSAIFVMYSVTSARAAERKYVVPFSYDPSIYVSYYPDVTTSTCGETYIIYPGHEGMDYIMPIGTPIYAADSGTVTHAVQSCSSWLCYGNYLYINHGNNNWTLYAHLNSYVVADGASVNQGDLIAYSGTSGTDTPHLHWEVITGSSAVGGNPHNPYYCNNEWFTTNPPTYADESGYSEAFTAIEEKSTELYWINRNESVSPATPGLIATETQNISLDTTLRDPYYVEYWDGGQWGEVLFTYDEGNEYQGDRAYIVRGGFLRYRDAADPSLMGPPLGDELDSTQVSTYTSYDSYCTPLYSAQGYSQIGIINECIEEYCGSSSTYTSVQRFQYLTLCYNPSVGVECDPKWEAEHGSMNPACSREAEAVTATSTSTSEGNLWIYNSTIYWVHNGSTHGIGSAELFEACGFSWSDPYPVTEDTFNELPQGSLVDDPTDCGAVVDGSLVSVGGTVFEYWSDDSSWHGYSSDLVFDACLNDWSSIQEMSSSVFSTIPTGSVVSSSFDCGLTYPGLLLSWNGTAYRITETGLKRGFASAEAFLACGYEWSDVWALSFDDYPVVTTLMDGSAISSTADCGNVGGDLVHWEWTGTIYYLTGTGYKRGVTSTEAMTSCGFDWNQVRYVSSANGAVVWTLGDAANITGQGDCP